MSRSASRRLKSPSQVAQVVQLQEWIDSGLAEDWRKRAGISLAAAGRDIEVDAAAVLKWERREHRPRGRNVRAYYRFLLRLKAALDEVAA